MMGTIGPGELLIIVAGRAPEAGTSRVQAGTGQPAR